MADKSILFAGTWVEGVHILADAAVDSGRSAGKSISAANR